MIQGFPVSFLAFSDSRDYVFWNLDYFDNVTLNFLTGLTG
jgi:hypothetical protein